MMNRRSFLKFSSLAAFALAAGYNAGNILKSGPVKKYSLIGFIPDDKKIIHQLIRAFKSEIKSNYLLVFENNNDPDFSFLTSSFETSSFSDNILLLRINKIRESVKSDILITSSDNYMLQPENEFAESFSALRKNIKGREASYYFSLVYEENIIPSLFSSSKRSVLIEDDKGLIDKTDLSKNYDDIEIKGIQGNTTLSIHDGLVRIKKASCRHKLCEKKGIIAGSGDIIACAPNKLLITIENT